MVEFIKKHKVPLIIMAVSVGLYLLYDYLTAQSAANAASNAPSDDTDAADQAALQDELASLQAGSTGDVGSGSISSPVATSPAVSGVVPAAPVSTGTVSSTPTQSESNPSSINVTGTATAATPVTASGVLTALTPTDADFTQLTFAQQQQVNANANATQGSAISNAATAELNALYAGNPALVAQEQNYNTMFTEQDPQQAAMAYAAGENPFIAMLDQGVAGGAAEVAQTNTLQQGFEAATGNVSQFIYPPSIAASTNTSESSGGESSTAGASGSGATVSTSSGSSTASGITPGQLPAGSRVASTSTVRPITTITPSGSGSAGSAGGSSSVKGTAIKSTSTVGSAGSAGGITTSTNNVRPIGPTVVR
jgi:trimeric autotransporter adhesin